MSNRKAVICFLFATVAIFSAVTVRSSSKKTQPDSPANPPLAVTRHAVQLKNSSPENTTNSNPAGDLKSVRNTTQKWGQFGFDSQNTGRSPVTGPQTKNLKWVYKAGSSRCGYQSVLTSPVLDAKGNIYFGTSEGSVFALSPTKTVLWEFRLPDAYSRDNCDNRDAALYGPRGLYDININGAPAIDQDGTLYFGTSGAQNTKKIYALDTSTGMEKWSYKIDGALSSDIRLGANENIYFKTTSTLYSIDKDKRNIGTYRVDDIFSTPVVGSDGSVLVCTGNNGLVALDQDLNFKWNYKTPTPLAWCLPAINPENGNIYFPSGKEKKLYALNPDGTLQWKADIYWAESAPSIAKDGTIYIGSSGGPSDVEDITSCEYAMKGGGVFLAFNPDGTEKWRYFVPPILGQTEAKGSTPGSEIVTDCYDNSRAIDGSSIVSADGTIYFGTDAKVFIALNPDGTEKWRFGFGDVMVDEFDRRPAIDSRGTLYVAPAGGRFGGLFAINDNAARVFAEDDLITSKTNALGEEQELKESASRSWTPNSNFKINQQCRLKSEKGKTCDSKRNCSSGEFVNGCCIAGVCNTVINIR